MKVYINNTQIKNDSTKAISINNIKFERTLKRNIDKATLEITNIPLSFFPLEEKELILKDDKNNILWGGIIKRIEPERITTKGDFNYNIIAHSWEDKLKRKYFAGTLTGYLSSVVPDLFSGTICDSGFSFNVDPQLKIKKISTEENVLELLESFANTTDSIFYITPEREVNFIKEFEESNIIIDDKNSNQYKDYSFEPDTTQLATVIKLRNCEVLSNARIEDNIHITDGITNTFNLSYKLSDVSGFIQSGGSGDWYPQSIGIENLNSSGFDFYYNFNAKYMRCDTPPVSGNSVKFTGYYYYPFFTDYEDKVSIDNMISLLGSGNTDGKFEYLTDQKEVSQFKSAQDAIEYCKKLINEKSNVQIDGKIEIEQTEPVSNVLGKTCTVTQSHQGLINQKFLITKIRCQIKNKIYQYTLETTSFLHGIGDIIGKLFKKTGTSLDDNDTIPLSVSVADNIEITENLNTSLENSYLIFGGEFGNTSLE